MGRNATSLAKAVLAGSIGDGAEVKIGARDGALTVGEQTVGGEAAEEAPRRKPTVVHFPGKG